MTNTMPFAPSPLDPDPFGRPTSDLASRVLFGMLCLILLWFVQLLAELLGRLSV